MGKEYTPQNKLITNTTENLNVYSYGCMQQWWLITHTVPEMKHVIFHFNKSSSPA